MKELSIEEKAKRYDDAINAIKELKAKHPTAHVIKDWIKENFPELAESEDEKIRKRIIHALHGDVLEMSEIKEAVAWLEKQKHEEWGLYDEKILSEIFTSVEIAAYSEEKKKEIISWLQKYRPYMHEKQGEQEQDINIQINPSEYINDMGGNGCYLKNVTQVSAWSEEDERLCQCIIEDQEEALDKVSNDKYGHSEIISDLEKMYRERIAFLKSLKDRVVPQQKQEWSEEDEKKRRLLISILEVNHPNGYFKVNPSNTLNMEAMHTEELVSWLKSLRPQNWTKEDKERYISCLQRLGTGNPEQPETINSKWFKEHVYPQNTWKPSDEQMKALSNAGNSFRPFEEGHKVLWGLYNDLKKLREE